MAGSLGAGAHARACAYEAVALDASGYRSSPEHRARAPISQSRTEPQARHGDPLPVSVRSDLYGDSPMSGQHTSVPRIPTGRDRMNAEKIAAVTRAKAPTSRRYDRGRSRQCQSVAASSLAAGARQARGERARALAEEVRARIGELASVAEAPQGADSADAMRPRRRHVEVPVADHHRTLRADHPALDQVADQLRLVVEAPARLGSVDALEVPRQPEVAEDARGRPARLGGDHQQGPGQARGGLEHLGHPVVDRVLEETHVVVARPVVTERGL